MLSFLYPAFLIGAIAAAVPIVLHLIRREAAPELPFSAVRLLRRTPLEQIRRQRLRELLLLALRVTALALLAAAFARPYVAAAGGGDSGATLVAVDRSFSMSAPGRFERARALAAAAVRDAPSGAAVGLLAFDDRPELLVEPRLDRGAVLAALDRLAPTQGGTRYAPALALATAAMRGAPGRLVVVTDLQRAGWSQAEKASVPPGVGIEVADAGGPVENLAVVSAQWTGGDVVALIRNAGARSRQSRVTLRANGRVVASSRVDAPAGATVEARFEGVAPGAAAASVRIDDVEGFQADNERYLVSSSHRGPRALVVAARGARAAFYVERALAAAPEDGRFRVEVVDEPAVSRALTASGEAPALVFVAAARALDRQSRDALQRFVRAGGGLVLAAGPDLDPDILSAISDARIDAGAPTAAGSRAEIDLRLAAVDARHPIFRPLGAAAAALGQVRFTRAWRVDMPVPDWTVVARFTDGTPALAERQVDRGTVLLFASDLGHAWNDFPVHPVFVPFVHEVFAHVAHVAPAPRELVVADAPPGTPRAPGIVTLANGRRLAINVDPRESDAERMAPAEFIASVARLHDAGTAERGADARARESEQRYWRYGLMLMLAALAAEGLLATDTHG
jgi:hypothetical protein